MKPMVIGVGNRYRGDDAFSWQIISQLKTQFPESAQYRHASGDLTHLIDHWKHAAQIVLIDAVRSEALAPGTIVELDLHSSSQLDKLPQVSTHGLGVREGVMLAFQLGIAPEKIDFLGLVGKNWDMGQQLSPQIESQLPKVVERVQKLLASA